MSDWSNLEEILQDLSLAQGYAVPGRLEAVAAAGPPPIHVPDEASVERAYYESLCVAGGDFAPPDYEQIKLMLDLVKIDEEENDIKSSELNPSTSEIIPRQKEKIKINVAHTASLATSIGEPIEVAKEAVLAARRPVPNEIIPKMFKKKILSHIEVRKEKPSQTSQPSSPDRMQQYTPSADANVYYSKYLQKSMLKEQIAEDIWVKAEKQMKEIEARQRQKAELTPKERGNTSPHTLHVCLCIFVCLIYFLLKSRYLLVAVIIVYMLWVLFIVYIMLLPSFYYAFYGAGFLDWRRIGNFGVNDLNFCQ